jgi:hypothetical protein
MGSARTGSNPVGVVFNSCSSADLNHFCIVSVGPIRFRSYGVTVSTLDFESSDGGSNPPRTFYRPHFIFPSCTFGNGMRGDTSYLKKTSCGRCDTESSIYEFLPREILTVLKNNNLMVIALPKVRTAFSVYGVVVSHGCFSCRRPYTQRPVGPFLYCEKQTRRPHGL